MALLLLLNFMQDTVLPANIIGRTTQPPKDVPDHVMPRLDFVRQTTQGDPRAGIE